MKYTLCTLILLSALGSAVAQEPVSHVPDEAPVRSANAEALRTRIHDMRMNLLLGGDRVRQAEREAIDFYSSKAELVDRSLDGTEVELSEKRASYDVVLDRALNSDGSASRTKALGEAAALRGEITSLESDSANLSSKRANLARIVTAVEARERDRERLVAKLETSSDFDHEMGLPFTSIGLAPSVSAEPVAASPLDDANLVRDLMERDPRGARRTLFELDPVRYWELFPLTPPAPQLRRTLSFPLADLPGRR